MHWSSASYEGTKPPGVRSHTTTRVGSKLFVIGGSASDDSFNNVTVFDADTFFWYKPEVRGSAEFGPHRAHSATLVQNGCDIFVFGGGDGPNYFDTLFILNTKTMAWSQPKVTGTGPGPRRAHSATLVGKDLYIFGGGDGRKALNDIFILDTDLLAWRNCEVKGDVPPPRGYHASCLLDNNKILVYGGSDGQECFSDVAIFDTVSSTWSKQKVINPKPRLGHTVSAIGNTVFAFGGHNGTDYVNDLDVLSMRGQEWTSLPHTGTSPQPRGYHTATYYDSRLFVYGGFDNSKCFDEITVLDLSIYAYFGLGEK